jgi:ABC-2 type transport system ATP-binding protein
VSQVLLIDVDEGSEELLAEFGRRGLEPRRHERSLLVDLSGDATYDIVRDAIADLALPLNRLEQRRRRVEELFQDDDDVADGLATAGAGTNASGSSSSGGGPSGTPEAPHVR